MKIISGTLGAAVLAALLVAGCNNASRYEGGALHPAISVDGPKTMMVGESQKFFAHTVDIANGKPITWAVEPNGSGGKITPDNNTNGQIASFSSTQRGRYIISARGDLGNGHDTVLSSTTVDVTGTTAAASDHMTEPVR